MELTLKAQLVNIFKKDSFEDKETGEVKEGKYVAQFMSSKVQNDGSQKNTLADVSLPESIYKQIVSKVGDTINLKVAVWSSGNKNGLYGIE